MLECILIYRMEELVQLDAVAATDFLRCYDTLDLTNTLQMKMYQEWKRRGSQQKEIEAQKK